MNFPNGQSEEPEVTVDEEIIIREAKFEPEVEIAKFEPEEPEVEINKCKRR